MNTKFYDDLKVLMPKGCSFNYGYYSTSLPDEIVDFRQRYLDFDYEFYAINLYDTITETLTLKNKVGIDFSCGRAGGSAYLAYAKEPKLLYATDRSQANIDFARSKFDDIANLRLEVSEVEHIGYPSAHFDFVLNVASYRIYRDPKFSFSEFLRILKNGGDLIIADQFNAAQIDAMHNLIGSTNGISLIGERDLTAGTMEAMAFTQNEKRYLIDQFGLDDETRGVALEWGGLPESAVYNEFATRKSYFNIYHIRKHA
jgi:SAM-dependent methyltransferase